MDKSNHKIPERGNVTKNEFVEVKKKRQRITKKSEVTVHQWTFSTENK